MKSFSQLRHLLDGHEQPPASLRGRPIIRKRRRTHRICNPFTFSCIQWRLDNARRRRKGLGRLLRRRWEPSNPFDRGSHQLLQAGVNAGHHLVRDSLTNRSNELRNIVQLERVQGDCSCHQFGNVLNHKCILKPRRLSCIFEHGQILWTTGDKDVYDTEIGSLPHPKLRGLLGPGRIGHPDSASTGSTAKGVGTIAGHFYDFAADQFEDLSRVIVALVETP